MQQILLLAFYVCLQLLSRYPLQDWSHLSTEPAHTYTVSASDSAWLAKKEKAHVDRVVDGDTIELSDGRKLRYIGVDTPETVDPRRGVQCFGKEAAHYNSKLVAGKDVWLEKDVSDTDRYGRLLRYVYTASESGQLLLVNQELVKYGFAFASAYPPDMSKQALFNQEESLARKKGVGLWDDNVCDSQSLPKKMSEKKKRK